MPAIAYDGVVLLGLLYLMWLASDKGIVATSIAAAEVFVSLSLALVLYEPIAGFVFSYLDQNLAFFLPQSISDSLGQLSIFLVFSLLMWGTLAALWVLVHPNLLPNEEEEVEAGMPILDKAGAALVAVYAGNLLFGAALITWSMCPFLWKIPTNKMYFDVGRTALKSTGRFLGEWHDGRSIPLYGEPLAERSDREALLSSEAWGDYEFNGEGFFDGDYYDADKDGAFTKDLYYFDIDDSRNRRIGMIEKYAANAWDNPLVNDRQREDTKPKPPPAAEKPVEQTVAKKDTAKPSQPPKPAAEPPGQSAPIDFLDSLGTKPMTGDSNKPAAAANEEDKKPKQVAPVIDF